MRLMRLMRPMREVGARRSGPVAHALADRGADRRALTADSQRPMSLAACLLFTFLVYDHLIQYQGHARTVMALVAGSLAVFFGLARLAAQVPRFRRRMQEHAYEVALLFCLVISLDAIIGLVATGQPWETGPIIFDIVLMGGLLHQQRYAGLVVALLVGSWTSVAASYGFNGEWGDLAPIVMAAAVLAAVLNRIRCRTADRLVAVQQAAARSALTDALTQLPNRRGFRLAGDALVGLARQAQRPLTLLFIDVDGLKRANDTGGHTCDRLLQATAEAMRSAVRSADVLGRLGGDEFTVLLTDAGPTQVARVVARLELELQKRGAAASVGQAHLDLADPGQTLEDLIDAGDAAMYVVKQQRYSQRSATSTVTPRDDAERAPEAVSERDIYEDAWLAERHDRADRVSDLRAFSVGGALALAGGTPIELVVLPHSVAASVAMVLAVSAAVFALVGAMLQMQRTSAVDRYAAGLLVGLAVVLDTTAVLHAVLIGQPWASTAVMLAVLTTAALVRTPRRAVPVMVGAVTAMTVHAVLQQPMGDSQSHMYQGLLIGSFFSGIFLQVTQKRTLARLAAARLQVQTIAATDEMTALCNRRGFLTAGYPLVDLSRRAGEGAGVIYLDVDGLKQINDLRGHLAGDRLLVRAADVLRAVVRPSAIAARLGGDEFAVLLPRSRPLELAQVATELRSGLADHGVAASIGTGYLEGDRLSLDSLLDLADASMYRAKHAPSNPPGVPGPRREIQLRSSLSSGQSWPRNSFW